MEYRKLAEFEEDSDINAAVPCPMCNGSGNPMGKLGKKRWYRCRDCGMDFNREEQ